MQLETVIPAQPLGPGGAWSVGTRRRPAAVVLLTIVTLGVYAFYWLYKTNVEIREAGLLRFRVGHYLIQMLVFFALVVTIPLAIILFFAFLYRGALNVALVQKRAGIAPQVNARALLWVSLVPLLGFWIYEFVLQSAANELWDRLDRRTQPQAPPGAGSTAAS